MIRKIIISTIVVAALFGGIFLLQKNKTSVQTPVKQAESTEGNTYTNEEYGFEIKTLDQLTTLTSNNTSSVLYNGKTYSTTQMTFGENFTIHIIKGWAKADVDPRPYFTAITPTSNNIAGVTWYGFYDARSSTPQCASAEFQTLTKDGKDTIIISFDSTINCPGDINQEQQILSNFKFIDPIQVIDCPTRYKNTEYGFELDCLKGYSILEYPASRRQDSGWPHGLILLQCNPSLCQTYPMAVEVWDSESEFKNTHNKNPDLSQKVGSKIITVQNDADGGHTKGVANMISTFKFTDQEDTTYWKTYTNDQYGFELNYPSNYSVAPINWMPLKGQNILLNLEDAKVKNNVSNVSIQIISEDTFNLESLKRFAPTGAEDLLPQKIVISEKYFYYYGPGGGGVQYNDQYFFNLNGKLLIFEFDGPYDNDKTPSAAAKLMEKEIFSTFKFTK